LVSSIKFNYINVWGFRRAGCLKIGSLVDKNNLILDIQAGLPKGHKTLRQKLQTDLTVSFFSTVDELKSTVSASLKDIPSSPTADPIDPYESELKATYLNWVMAQSSLVPLSGIDPETAREKREELNLGSIYTALLTQSASDDARQHLKEKPSESLSALVMLNQHKHLVILGDPGSGKSTFVNFVAWCLAGESIQGPYANIERLTTPLPDDEGKDQEKRQRWDHGVLVGSAGSRTGSCTRPAPGSSISGSGFVFPRGQQVKEKESRKRNRKGKTKQ